MKAARISRYGDVGALEYGEFDIPAVGADDVLVKVLATTVSRWDLKFREGELKDVKTLPGRRSIGLPMQLGRDVAGVVESVGSAVETFRRGDRVVGLVHPANIFSPMTMRGLSNLSTGIDYPAHTIFGGNAQFVSRPESYWLHLPEAVSPVAAAAAMWSYATAHRILVDRLASRVGDHVLIVGGSGGMGSAAIDLARSMGVKIVAVTRSAAKIPFLKALGSSDVFDLSNENTLSNIRALSEFGLDGALDFSGDEAMLRLCIDALRPAGTLVVAAHVADGPRLPISAYDCVRLELNIKGARASTLHDQNTILRLLADKVIEPQIHAVMPLSQIQEAHQQLASGTVSGRIVLDPWA